MSLRFIPPAAALAAAMAALLPLAGATSQSARAADFTVRSVEVPELKLGPDHDVAVVVAKHARGEEEAPAAEGGEEKK